MKAFLNHLAFEFRTGLRNPGQSLMNYFFPLGFYVMMGVVMIPINPLFAAALVPAMIAVTAMASALLGLPGTIVESREAGIYRSFKINGVPAASILTIPTLSTVLPIVIVSVIITMTAPLFKGALPAHWGWFIVVTLLTAASYAALGALIGVVANDSRSTVLYSQLIFLPSMILGGLMLPTEILPAAIQPVARLLPATYTMQAYKGLAFGQAAAFSPYLSLAVLAASLVLSLALGIYLFNWDSRNSSRRGHPAMALLALAPYVAGILLA